MGGCFLKLKGRKLGFVAVVLSMFASIAAGCGGGDGNTVTLKMIESLTSPTRTEVIKQMLAKFMEQNPNIKVELISPPLQSADNKIAQILSAKEELDVLEVRDITAKQFVTNKWIEDLKAYTDKWDGYKTLNSNALSMATYIDNTPYFIPYGLYQKIMFYRKDWFDEKGLTPPKTWQELYETGKKLTDPANNRYGYSFRGGAGANGYITEIIQDYNGNNINPDDSMFLKDGKTMYSSPEAVEAMKMYMNIYKDISPKDSLNWSYPEMVEGFVSGVTAILLQDPEVIDVTKQKMKEGTWATAPLPTGPQGQAHFGVGAAGWGMTSYSKHKEEAWKLIQFLSSPEENLFFTKKVGLIPIHTTAADDEFFKTGAYAPYLEMNAKPDNYVAVKPATDYAGSGEFNKINQEDGQALILNKMTIEDALKKWDEYWTKEKQNKK